MPEFDVAELRAALVAELEDLQSLREASAEARKTVTLDQQSVGRLSRVDAMQGQAMAQAAERRRAARIGLVKAALQRLDEGEFGVCTECGEDIAAGRLKIDPAVPTCVRCAGS